MEFYADKSRELSRFIYRNVADVLAKTGDAAARAALIDNFCQFIAELQPSGDWQKMKWCLPAPLAERLNEAERQKIEEALSSKRKRRNDRLLEVFPHCGDEFSTVIPFLDAAFGSKRYGLITPATNLFTLGSCFARNIAVYLEHKGFNIAPYIQAEDLNSPFSNAKLLSVCAAAPAIKKAYIEHWVSVLYPSDGKTDPAAVVTMELQKLDQLHASLKSCEFLIVTCGNVLDYFMPPLSATYEVGPAVAPKFLTISSNEDITVRSHLTGKLKEAGAEFRIGTYAEAGQAMDCLYAAIRAINPDATLLFTLSPVPIDSALGLKHKLGAVEIDCISKSLLRAVLHEFMEKQEGDEKLFYFPSFEVVRWIGACMEGPIFSKEDAASRHVSQQMLGGVYDYFIHKFVKD